MRVGAVLLARVREGRPEGVVLGPWSAAGRRHPPGCLPRLESKLLAAYRRVDGMDSDGSDCDCRANGRTKCDALSHGTSRGSSPGGAPKRVCGVTHGGSRAHACTLRSSSFMRNRGSVQRGVRRHRRSLSAHAQASTWSSSSSARMASSLTSPPSASTCAAPPHTPTRPYRGAHPRRFETAAAPAQHREHALLSPSGNGAEPQRG